MVLGAALGLGLLASTAGCERKLGRPAADGFCPGGEDLARWVDPMIGTRGAGNAIHGALVPHGMVKLSPDTDLAAGAVDSYEYDDAFIEGFSHTQLQGPGGSGYGYSQILVVPASGPLRVGAGENASRYSHAAEWAEPGYYAVDLLDSGIHAELSATGHAGLHRYTFPAGAPARLLIDLGHSLGESTGGRLEVVGDEVIRGCADYQVHPLVALLLADAAAGTGASRVCFHARFDPPFSEHGTWSAPEGERVARPGSRRAGGPHSGAWAGWAAGDERTVELRLGLSLIDEDGAAANLEAETAGRSFAALRAAARKSWNCLLGRIRVSGGTPEALTSFYTALYHSHFAPADYTEAGGRFYSAADGRGAVSRWQTGRFYTDDWCAWDTFRTSRPLATLIEPEVVDDVVRSYLHLYQQGGWLPKCSWHAAGYSRVMIGNHAVAIIADARVKGFTGFDAEVAWEAVAKAAAVDDNPPGFADGLCGYFNLGTPSGYLQQGYVSHECDPTQGASMTLEYAYDDWAAARLAAALGREDERARFDERAGNWRRQWDAETGFMRGRHADGSWVSPFDPAEIADFNDFCEASAWIYTWFVPHDPAGLMERMGGREAFIARLDTFFDDGHFDPSNEPSFHVPWLYNRAGRPDRTQRRVLELLDGAFAAAPGGLPGNDDAGATSAWYVLAACGLFPLAPGEPRYEISTPLFERVALRLHPAHHPGGEFVILAPRSDPEAMFIQSASLNGAPLERSWLRHAEISAGGTLRLELGRQPAGWAAGGAR